QRGRRGSDLDKSILHSSIPPDCSDMVSIPFFGAMRKQNGGAGQKKAPKNKSGFWDMASAILVSSKQKRRGFYAEENRKCNAGGGRIAAVPAGLCVRRGRGIGQRAGGRIVR